MNIVIYARFSSHNQNEQSIEGQLKTCYEYAQKNDYTIIGEYIDRALSGTTDNRPQFQKMIEDSNKKQFQGVLVYQLDRFARNRYDSAIYKSRLKKNGVRVFSARENISDDASGILVEGLLESMAEYYSAELSQKIKRGMDINAGKCLCTGGNIALGFKVDDTKHFVVDENTAPIVRKVFELYAGGQTVQQITDYLNSQQIKTSRGVEFNKNSLRKMLRNKRYIGIYTYKDTEIKDGMPRIIEDELFNTVQEIMDKNRKAPARARAKEEYLLTTKLFCGKCKNMMTGISGTSKTGKVHNYYTCTDARKKLCDKKAVKKDYIENLVIEECRKLLTTENINKIASEVVAICEKEKDNSNLKRLNKLLKDNQKAIDNLIKALESGQVIDIITNRIQEKTAEQKEIQAQIAVENMGQVNITVPQIKFFLSELKKGNINDIKYRKTLINVFVNSIYLYDDKITFIFNSGDAPVTVDTGLLDEIEQECDRNKSSYMGNVAPPIEYYTNLYYFKGGFAVTIFM